MLNKFGVMYLTLCFLIALVSGQLLNVVLFVIMLAVLSRVINHLTTSKESRQAFAGNVYNYRTKEEIEASRGNKVKKTKPMPEDLRKKLAKRKKPQQ